MKVEKFEKVHMVIISRKSIQWETSFSDTNRRTEAQTDVTKLTIAFFENFVNASKN